MGMEAHDMHMDLVAVNICHDRKGKFYKKRGRDDSSNDIIVRKYFPPLINTSLG